MDDNKIPVDQDDDLGHSNTPATEFVGNVIPRPTAIMMAKMAGKPMRPRRPMMVLKVPEDSKIQFDDNVSMSVGGGEYIVYDPTTGSITVASQQEIDDDYITARNRSKSNGTPDH